jgi:hypothetical protein
VWTSYFMGSKRQAIQPSPGSSDGSWVQTGKQEELRLEALASAKNESRKHFFGKTDEEELKEAYLERPTKLFKVEAVADLIKETQEIEPVSGNPTKLSQAVRAIIGEWPKVASNFQNIREELQYHKAEQDNISGVLVEELDRGFGKLSEDLNGIRDYIEVLKGELGPEKILGPESIREHILELVTTLAQVKSGVTASKDSSKKNEKGLQTLNVSLSNLGDSHRALYASINKYITNVERRMTVLEQSDPGGGIPPNRTVFDQLTHSTLA